MQGRHRVGLIMGGTLVRTEAGNKQETSQVSKGSEIILLVSLKHKLERRSLWRKGNMGWFAQCWKS